MEDVIGLVFTIGFPIFLLGMGLFFGGAAERRHFRRLEQRESAVQHVFTTQVRSYLVPVSHGKPPTLIVAETVIASDYLKTFLAALRNIFGGNVRSFETLLERGRREVTVQLQERAAELGYNAICNVRLSSANVGGNGPKGVAMAAVLGWATAYEASAEPAGAPVSHGI